MEVFVDRIMDLLEDVEKYKIQFPSSFTSIRDIEASLKERVNDPVGSISIFGIQVSDEWEDKCYVFEVDRMTPTHTVFRYVGIWKT